MTTKKFRITLLPNADSLCEKLAVLAAKSNGGQPVTLTQLKTVIDSYAIEYPTLYGDTVAELIGENLLHIDRKIGESWHTVAVIEEVEIMEPEMAAAEE